MASSYIPGLLTRLPIYLAISVIGTASYLKPKVDEQNTDRLNRVIDPIITSQYGSTQPYQLYDIPSNTCQTSPSFEIEKDHYSKRAVSIQVGNTTMGYYCLETMLDTNSTALQELPIYNYSITRLKSISQ